MKSSNILLLIFLIVFIISLTLGSASIVNKLENYQSQLTGKTTTGRIELTVQAVCGNSVCQSPAENCDTCLTDCAIPTGNVCCSGVNTTGDCCSDSDCSSGQECISNQCTTVSVPGGGGGAGGGGRGAKGGVTIRPAFDVTPDPIEIFIKQGQFQRLEVIISNTGAVYLPFNIKLVGSEDIGIEDFITLSKTQFSLETLQSETIILDVNFPRDMEPDVYTGHLLIETPSITKKVPIILEGETIKILFDVSTIIPKEYKLVEIGNDVWATISIFNFVGLPKEVELYYAIKDLNDSVLIEKIETVNIEEGTILTKILNPGYIEEGEYVFYSRITHLGYTAVSGDIFTYAKTIKVEAPFPLPANYILFIIIILVLIIFNVMYWYHRYRLKRIEKTYKKDLDKYYKSYKKGILSKQKRERQKDLLNIRLKRQLRLLGKAYQSRFISGNAYQKSKERIKNVLKKIK